MEGYVVWPAYPLAGESPAARAFGSMRPTSREERFRGRFHAKPGETYRNTYLRGSETIVEVNYRPTDDEIAAMGRLYGNGISPPWARIQADILGCGVPLEAMATLTPPAIIAHLATKPHKSPGKNVKGRGRPKNDKTTQMDDAARDGASVDDLIDQFGISASYARTIRSRAKTLQK